MVTEDDIIYKELLTWYDTKENAGGSGSEGAGRADTGPLQGHDTDSLVICSEWKSVWILLFPRGKYIIIIIIIILELASHSTWL